MSHDHFDYHLCYSHLGSKLEGLNTHYDWHYKEFDLDWSTTQSRSNGANTVSKVGCHRFCLAIGRIFTALIWGF